MFVAFGSLATIDGPAFFKPAPFAALDEAATTSLVWAEENEVPFVYVRAGQASAAAAATQCSCGSGSWSPTGFASAAPDMEWRAEHPLNQGFPIGSTFAKAKTARFLSLKRNSCKWSLVVYTNLARVADDWSGPSNNNPTIPNECIFFASG